jgi:hypothetical protein
MDGLNEHRHGGEFKWAVDTALASVEYGVCGLFDHTAEQFVEDSFEFIVASFEGEGLETPSKTKLIEAVREEQKATAMDWICDHVLEGGQKLCGQSITDDQWNEICHLMNSASITPPSRIRIERYISEKIK